MKTKFLLIGCILILVIIFFSCSKDDDVNIDTYQVTIENKYFERVDSLYIGQYFSDSLLLNQTSEPLKLKKQTYSFSCVTYSKLRLIAKVFIQGKNEKINLVINESGKISVE
jgi:hypothetical protein